MTIYYDLLLKQKILYVSYYLQIFFFSHLNDRNWSFGTTLVK